ncbi:MAG: RNA polymerase subunit sigma-70 [Phycisphaerales bacterium]|nr:RNA polymerase subunit sigma-70 [Phycisphaerae bacterium]NNF44381.1 RNA polymerase subunit sigma-70 [Phycisphaerales bacterium]NNM26602.1 RNA polymerase subunit sigma-70 [Phycisphaerales bacterium]
MPTPDLAPHVYDELRRLAAAQLRDQPAGHTLQPTALVNEAWVKLAANPNLRFEDRRAYLVLASRVMRQVLIDHARGKRRAKRGGNWRRVTLVAAEAPGGPVDVDLLALEEALEELAVLKPDRVRLVELRFFGGLTEAEAGQVLGVSERQVSRQWRTVKAWLRSRLGPDDGDAEG